MLPTNSANPHADLVCLAEALLDVEQSVARRRTTHLAMVDRMID
jgi:tryptophan 2,3-dioxygenase